MTRTAVKRLCSILTGVSLAGASALAQTPQERGWCESEDAVTVDQRIDGCSAVIKAARDKGDKLAEAFNNRGVGYRLKGDYDRAIADYNQAIKLNAKSASAYNNRGVAYDKNGEYDRAILDYDQAIKLDPKLAFALYGRGLARLKNEDPSGEADIAAAKALQSDIAEEYARYGMQEPR